MNRLTGFNYTEVNRRYAVYPETLEIEDLIHKPVSFKKSLTLLSNAMKKKSAPTISGNFTKRGNHYTKRNAMAQASHLTAESFKIPERLNYFLQKLYVQI